jgi:hypothetical protein
VTPVVEGHQVATAKDYPSTPWSPPLATAKAEAKDQKGHLSAAVTATSAQSTPQAPDPPVSSIDANTNWYESIKSALALVGLLAIALQFVKLVR